MPARDDRFRPALVEIGHREGLKGPKRSRNLTNRTNTHRHLPKNTWVYITTNRPNGVLYIDVTSDLKGRIAKHKSKTCPNSFTARYNLDKLVYFEKIDGIVRAIEREKQLKAGNRARQVKLVEGMNKEWKDLAGELQ